MGHGGTRIIPAVRKELGADMAKGMDEAVRVLVLPVTHSPPEGPHNRFTPEPPSPPASP